MLSRGTAPERSSTGPDAGEADDGRFQPCGAGAAVEDHIDAVAEIGRDMCGRRRADPARTDWRWARRAGRPPRSISARATGCAGTRKATVGSPALTRSAERRIRRGAAATRRQRSRPERLAPAAAHPARMRASRSASSRVGNMHDQRIETRPPLGLEDPRHRLAVEGIGAQAIDRFGRKGDETASRG